MLKQRRIKKLSINKETLRKLTNGELTNIAGAISTRLPVSDCCTDNFLTDCCWSHLWTHCGEMGCGSLACTLFVPCPN